MKKILAVMGSPRKGKNSDILLEKVLEGIKDNNDELIIKKVYLKDKVISPCVACDICGKTGICHIDDDMKQIYIDFDESDGIIIASPLYFNTVSSLTKIMIDRCQVFWSSKYILKNSAIDTQKDRKGLFICVGGAPFRENQFSSATPVMDLFFKAINTKYERNILVANTDNIPAWEREDIMQNAYDIGNKFLR